MKIRRLPYLATLRKPFPDGRKDDIILIRELIEGGCSLERQRNLCLKRPLEVEFQMARHILYYVPR